MSIVVEEAMRCVDQKLMHSVQQDQLTKYRRILVNRDYVHSCSMEMLLLNKNAVVCSTAIHVPLLNEITHASSAREQYVCL